MIWISHTAQLPLLNGRKCSPTINESNIISFNIIWHLHSCYSKFLVCILSFSSKTTELIQLNFWEASSWLGNIFGQNIYSSRFLFSENPKKLVLETNWWEKMPLLGQGEHLYSSLNLHYHSFKGHCM